MMPSALLRQRGTFEPYLGNDANGPLYGPPVQVRTRVVGKRRTVRTAQGVDVIASAVADVRRDAPIPANPTQARLTIDDRTYTVLDVAEAEDLTARHHRQLILEGPR